jgi:hypothetical protein
MEEAIRVWLNVVGHADEVQARDLAKHICASLTADFKKTDLHVGDAIVCPESGKLGQITAVLPDGRYETDLYPGEAVRLGVLAPVAVEDSVPNPLWLGFIWDGTKAILAAVHAQKENALANVKARARSSDPVEVFRLRSPAILCADLRNWLILLGVDHEKAQDIAQHVIVRIHELVMGATRLSAGGAETPAAG